MTAHLLLVATPRPLSYFSWIVGLATTVAAVLPILSVEPLSAAVAAANAVRAPVPHPARELVELE